MRLDNYSYSRTIGSSVRLLFDSEYYQQIFSGLMLNYFPFTNEEIQRLHIDYTYLTHNPNVDWSRENIKRSQREGHTNCISLFDNASIVWDNYLLENVGLDKIDWVYIQLSNKKNVRWSEEFIDKNRNNFDWTALTKNPYIRWSENWLLKFQNEIEWPSLLENPSIRWTPNLISRVRSSLTDIGWNRNNYAKKALEFGFCPDNDDNIIQKATDFLKQFGLYSPDASFQNLMWESLADNGNIMWSRNCLCYYPKLDLGRALGHNYSANPFCEEDDYKAYDFDNEFIEKLFNISEKSIDLCYILLTNTHFWNKATLTKYYEPIFDGTYMFGSLCYNKSVSWDVSLFTFFREKVNTEYSTLEKLTERKRLFDFLYNQYGRNELISYFEETFGDFSFLDLHYGIYK